MKAVIIAGGGGSRLWPLSRSNHPKQFLSLGGQRTMLQETANRLADLPIESTITICNEKHRFLVAEQLNQIGELGKIILEPVGKNTAPAIALAALMEKGEDPLLLVVPADHLIFDQGAFTQTIRDAMPLAAEGRMVTFGVKPTEPHIGYGYIEAGEEVEGGFAVSSFKEKPSFESATAFLDEGGYFWNSGMFLFRASRYIEELKLHSPDILLACDEAVRSVKSDLDFVRVDAEAFEKCPGVSIDYAVMERTSDAVVVPMDAAWNDVGSWSSLWEASKKDSSGNATAGDVILHKASNSFIHADDRLTVGMGIDELVVVSTKDALLVAHKAHVQDTKLIVDMLRERGRREWEFHREVHRPWGKYDSIDVAERFQVKRITVQPGAKLSVQMHQHRSEHWVVVSGLARVTNGDKTFSLVENESTFIPSGVVHALENPGEVPLEIIEVQVGSYLGEDDIVRFKDLYGRVAE